MKIRFKIYLAMLAGAILFGILVNLNVNDTPPSTSPATAKDLAELRASLVKPPRIKIQSTNHVTSVRDTANLNLMTA